MAPLLEEPNQPGAADHSETVNTRASSRRKVVNDYGGFGFDQRCGKYLTLPVAKVPAGHGVRYLQVGCNSEALRFEELVDDLWSPEAD